MKSSQWRWIGPDGFEYTGDLETLRGGLAKGQLPNSTMVWSPALDGWLPAHEIAELGVSGFAEAPAPVQTLPAFVPEDDAPTVQENPIPEAPPGAVEPWAVQEPRPLVHERAWQSRPPPPPPRKNSLLLLGVGAVGGAVIVAALGGVVLYLRGDGDKAAPPPASVALPSASAPAPKADAPATCSASAAKELAKTVVGRVNLDTASLEGGRFALAFAVTKTSARAVVLDAASLEVKQTLTHPSAHAIVGVFLTPSGDSVELGADVDGEDLKQPRTVAAKPPFTVGILPGGVGKSVGDAKPEVLWPGGEGGSTIPRVDTLSGVGHFVTLRRGGLGGKISAGWLDPAGRKKTELEPLEIDAKSLGTPSAAVGPSGGLLVVAARADDQAPWQVYAGQAKPGEVPKKLTPLALGDAATSRISPTASPLGEQWLLQWTEGDEGSHVVKVQILDAKLEARGQAVTVSRAGSDSGQGTLWTDGTHTASLFLVSTGRSHELWGATLACH